MNSGITICDVEDDMDSYVVSSSSNEDLIDSDSAFLQNTMRDILDTGVPTENPVDTPYTEFEGIINSFKFYSFF